MKWIFLLLILVLASCKKQEAVETNDVKTVDTLYVPKNETPADTVMAKKYSNERFREVTVEKISHNKFRIRGQGQIFEASFTWIIEDGHNELKKGFQMTDAGAPEWGKFDFTIDTPEKEANSTLTLILFEVSAKDGSRQYELPIALN